MFETLAFLSTVACVVIFVALFQTDRTSRRDKDGSDATSRRK